MGFNEGIESLEETAHGVPTFSVVLTTPISRVPPAADQS